MPGTIAGYIARLIVNATTMLRASRWSVDWRADNFDVTGFENSGFGTYVPGLVDFDIAFDAYWDTNDNPFNAPLDLQPAAVVSLRILYNKANGAGTQWYFPKVLILSSHVEGSVRDVVRYNVTAKATDDSPYPNTNYPTWPVT